MPRYTSKEISTHDMKVGQEQEIVIPSTGNLVRPDEPEIHVPDGPTINEYAKQLAFMEELVTVLVHESQQENDIPLVDVYVNGVAQFFPRGEPVTCKRKYVEGLARAKPVAISTEVRERNSENPTNVVHRRQSLRYPFSVIEDKNPNGSAWLRKVLAEV